jgi:ABC-2 type transport system permease protein
MQSEFRRIWLLARREYLQRVRTKSFLISTAVIPLFMFIVGVLPTKLATFKTGGTTKILVATDNLPLAEEFKRQLDRRGQRDNRKYEVEMHPLAAATTAEQRQKIEQEANHRGLDGVLWLTGDALAKQQVLYVTRSSTDFMQTGALRSAVVLAVAKHRLAQRGVTDDNFEDVLRLDLDTAPLAAGAARGQASFLTALFLVLILYMSVLINGMAVMRSVLEEKTSRVMEVMLATVTPRELMAGKIVGVGAVGLTQILIWGFIAAILTAPGIVAAQARIPFDLSLSMGVYFAIFYLLGYLLYSAMSAAVGAAVSSEEEAQQWQLVVAMPIIVAIGLMMQVYRFPDAPLSVVLSMIPFFAPILMYLRTLLQMPPAWQIALCLALLVGSIYAMLLISSRIYRVGILMYGKRPTLPELMRWLKQA